jgi:hypothetical protein
MIKIIYPFIGMDNNKIPLLDLFLAKDQQKQNKYTTSFGWQLKYDN